MIIMIMLIMRTGLVLDAPVLLLPCQFPLLLFPLRLGDLILCELGVR